MSVLSPLEAHTAAVLLAAGPRPHHRPGDGIDVVGMPA